MKLFQIPSIVEDDDFQGPISMRNTRSTIISAGSESVLKIVEKKNELPIRSEGWVCLPISSDKRFQYLSSIEDTIYNWADNENFILVRSNFDDRRLFLTCKYSSRYKKTKLDINAKRQGTGFKLNCPFIIRIKYKLGGKYWSVNEPLVDEEHTHNHPCTLHYNRITTKGKQKLTPVSDIETMTKMIQNKTRIHKIRKNLGVFKGAPVLSYQDVWLNTK